MLWLNYFRALLCILLSSFANSRSALDSFFWWIPLFTSIFAWSLLPPKIRLSILDIWHDIFGKYNLPLLMSSTWSQYEETHMLEHLGWLIHAVCGPSERNTGYRTDVRVERVAERGVVLDFDEASLLNHRPRRLTHNCRNPLSLKIPDYYWNPWV